MINSNGVVGTRELGSNQYIQINIIFNLEHPNISSGPVTIKVNNSNGTSITLDVTLDRRGDVTGTTDELTLDE